MDSVISKPNNISNTSFKSVDKSIFPEKKITHSFLNDKYLKHIPKTNAKTLLVLYLHNNLIEEITNLEKLSNLTHLYLQWNKITRIENMSGLQKLKKLYLGNNSISVIEKLEGLHHLKELHIERQQLEYGEGMCFEPRCLEVLGQTLQVLNISGNSLHNIDMVNSLHRISNVVAKNNLLEDNARVGEKMKALIHLREVDFRGNPMCAKHKYKESLIARCHKLEMVDGHAISNLTVMFIKGLEKNQKMIQAKKSEVSPQKSTVIQGTSQMKASPDDYFAMIEAKRLAVASNRKFRSNQVDSNGSFIPRCFWKNKSCTRSRTQTDTSELFHEFVKNTVNNKSSNNSEWP